MPVNSRYNFLNSDAQLGEGAFAAGNALWGGPAPDPTPIPTPAPRATPYIPSGITPDVVQAVKMGRAQQAPAPMPTPVQQPAVRRAPVPAPIQKPDVRGMQFPSVNTDMSGYDMPARPEYESQPMREPAELGGLGSWETLPLSDGSVSSMGEMAKIPQPEPTPERPDLSIYEQTTLGKKALERGFDPRQLLVALAEFSAGMGNIKGQPMKSDARSFYQMQLKGEQEQRENDMKLEEMAQRFAPKKEAPTDILDQQYKQAQIDYLKSKMQRQPEATTAQPDPLKQQLLQEQIANLKARTKALGSDQPLPQVAGGDPKVTPKSIRMASDLRKEYQNNATTKTTRDVKTQWNKVKEVLENPSAAGDMAAIFMFMKTLDPGSTVREGEYKSAAEATSAAGRVQTYAQNVSNGTKLNPEQRLDFKRTIEKFYRAQIKEQERVNREYRELAVRSGIDPRDLMIEADDGGPVKKIQSIHDLPDVR